MPWSEDILREREAIEQRVGSSPEFVVVRPEVWGELLEENMGADFSLGDLEIAVSESLQGPYRFLFSMPYEEEDGII